MRGLALYGGIYTGRRFSGRSLSYNLYHIILNFRKAMEMYINAQTVITAAAVLGAVATLLGGLSAVHSWYQRQNKQDEDIRAMKEEMCLLTYGVLACLKGLKEMGQNGTVTEAIDKIEKHMNQEAHK
jgi:hypothetical protein